MCPGLLRHLELRAGGRAALAVHAEAEMHLEPRESLHQHELPRRDEQQGAGLACLADLLQKIGSQPISQNTSNLSATHVTVSTTPDNVLMLESHLPEQRV